MRRSWFTLPLLVLSLLAPPSAWAQSVPQAGWWWNPLESGRGFFIESQDDFIYVGGYFYDSEGRAQWMVTGGPNTTPYSYQGRLLAYASGQTLFSGYRPPSTPVDMGAIAINFSDDTHGTVSWPGGVIPIERQAFGTGAPALQLATGWWWNPDESGRGYSVEMQGNNLFVVAFMYDDAGKPVWHYSAGPMTSPTRYEGSWLQFANGQTMTGAYRPPAAPVTIGRLAVEFTSAEDATFTFTEPGAAAAESGAHDKAGRIVNVAVKRQFKSKPYPYPKRYDGNFSYSLRSVRTLLGGTVTYEYEVSGALAFEPDPSIFLPGSVDYQVLAAGALKPLRLRVRYTSSDTVGKCIGEFVDQPIALPPNPSKVSIYPSGRFDGFIHIEDIPYSMTATCVTSIGTFPIDASGTVSVDIPMKRAIVYGLHDAYGPALIPNVGDLSWKYDFAEVI
ncbi:MAG: hypothetical protein ABI624_23195 [Casimicrobiaceae bacterium]